MNVNLYNYAFLAGLITRLLIEDMSFWAYIFCFTLGYLFFLFLWLIGEKLWNWRPAQRLISDFEKGGKL